MESMGLDTDTLTRILFSTVGIYIAVIVFTRINGLRTFSKMSSFDFAVTVAIGSVIAGTASSTGPSWLEGTITLAILITCQRIVSSLRYQGNINKATDNTPLLLMSGKDIHYDVLKKARVSENDLYAKLREANILDLDEVKAVVMEATGDISVLHGEAGGKPLNPELLKNVRGQLTT